MRLAVSKLRRRSRSRSLRRVKIEAAFSVSTPDKTAQLWRSYAVRRVPGVPKLAAGKRYLKEQLNAGGMMVPLSEGCLEAFVLDAIHAAARTQEEGESYILSLRRHLEERAQFILLWTGSEAATYETTWRHLADIAREHGLPSTQNSVAEF